MPTKPTGIYSNFSFPIIRLSPSDSGNKKYCCHIFSKGTLVVIKYIKNIVNTKKVPLIRLVIKRN